MESIRNITAGVYVLLQGAVGRLQQNELDWNDVLEVGTDVTRGFMQDANLAHRDHHTQFAEVRLDLDSDCLDYSVNLDEFPDFEPVSLQYMVAGSSLAGLGDVSLTDLDAMSQYTSPTKVYGAFYGSTATPDGLKLRLNVHPNDVANRCWRLGYRLPLFAQLQLGDRPPLPIEFMRMVKLAWTIAVVPVVKVNKQKRDDWRAWKRETLPQYEAELLGWNNPQDPVNPGRWQEYLNGGKGSSVQAVPRFDDHRSAGDGQMQGVVGPGGFWTVRR